MKKLTILISILLVAALCVSAGCTSTTTTTEGLKITNSDGSTVTLSDNPERIVLLNSNAGEILYLLGSADKVIGISQSIANTEDGKKMYPNAKVVGTWNEPDVEYLVSLDADLVIGYATSKPKNAEVLAAAGIPIVYIDCTKPATMASDIKEIGKLAGNEKKATEIADYYTDTMNKVSDVAQRIDAIPQSIYAESYTAYYAQGTNSGMGQLITLTGGENILNETGTPKVSDEWVVTSNPDIIVKLVNSMNNADSVSNEITKRTGFDRISAVKNNNVWIIRNDITYGPRSCAAAVALLQIQHPDVLPGMSAESVLTEFNQKFGTSFDTENLIYHTSA
ncbi:MAG TPA: ABC transporter substrate-binding protein [Methanocorpusculum sp.]|nr:ABC transporter substrate-binding protein [Methanocorpusculum sp.]